jgi:hypothetical protein
MMIKKLELWLNIVHYCFYKAEYRRYYWSNKLNPFMLLGKIPAVRRKFEELGTTHKDTVNKVWNDKRFGFGIMISGGTDYSHLSKPFIPSSFNMWWPSWNRYLKYLKN